MTACGLPHSEISGSSLVSSSPKLIAACYVLHRLWYQGIHLCALIYFLTKTQELHTFVAILEIAPTLAGGPLSCLAHESSSLCSFQGSRCRRFHAAPSRGIIQSNDPHRNAEVRRPQS